MTPFRKDARLGLAGRRKRAPSACPGSLRLRQQIAGTERLRTPQTEQPTVRRSAAPPGLPGLKPRCRQGRVLPRAPSGESGLPPFLASGITRIPPPSKPAMALASPASHHSDADSPAPLLSQGPRGDTGPRRSQGPLSPPRHLINNRNSICDFNPAPPRDQTQSRVPRIRSRQLWGPFFCGWQNTTHPG